MKLPTIVSKIIRLRILSQWSHVGICLGEINDDLFEKLKSCNKEYVKIDENDYRKTAIISARYKGVIIDVYEDDWYEEYTKTQILRVVAEKYRVDRAVEFCINEVGRKYDFCGLVDFLLAKKVQSEKRWFCSELVFEAYRRAGVEILVRKEKEFISPGDLYESPYLVLVE